MPLSTPQQQRQRVAILSRHRPNSPELVEARRDLATEKLAAYIERTVAEAPPLTDEQAGRLALLILREPA